MDKSSVNVTAEDLPIVCRRLPAETQEAYHAFMTYLCGGEKRSHAQTMRLIGHKAPGVIAKWSSEFDWVERCRQYDDWLYSSVAARKAENDIKEMLGRHTKQTANYLKLLGRIGKSLFKRIENDPSLLDNLDVRQHIEYVIRISTVLGKLQEAEALANGLTPTRRIELTGDGGGAVKVRLIPPTTGQAVSPEGTLVEHHEGDL